MRPIRRYRYVFTHPLSVTVTLDADGETPCIARGTAWQALEAQLRATPEVPVDNYWRLVHEEMLGIVSG